MRSFQTVRIVMTLACASETNHKIAEVQSFHKHCKVLWQEIWWALDEFGLLLLLTSWWHLAWWRVLAASSCRLLSASSRKGRINLEVLAITGTKESTCSFHIVSALPNENRLLQRDSCLAEEGRFSFCQRIGKPENITFDIFKNAPCAPWKVLVIQLRIMRDAVHLVLSLLCCFTGDLACGHSFSRPNYMRTLQMQKWPSYTMKIG